MIYVKCINGYPRISLTQPDDSWIPVDAKLSDKIVCKDGKPVVIKQNDYEKSRIIQKLKKDLSQYILSYYPLEKQQYDLTKKDFWISWLLVRRSDLTTDKIAQKVYDDASKILSGTTTYQEIISTYPTTVYQWNGMSVPESMAWIEILKVAIRIGWIKLCTTIYDTIEQKIKSSIDLSTFRNFDITEKLPKWPEI